MQKNTFLLFLSALFLTFSLLPLTRATAAPSPSPATSAKPDSSATPATTTKMVVVSTPTTPTQSEITDNLKTRLKDALNSDESPAPSPTYRAVIGQIHDVIQKTLVVDTKDGKRQIVVDDDTTILRSPGNAVIKFENLRIDDYLIAMGTLKDEDTFLARRLIASTTKLTDTSKVSGSGQITELNKDSLTLTISGSEIKLLVNKNTQIKSKDNPTLKLTDLTLNSRLIYTAEKDDEDNIATVLMVVQ